MKKKDYRIRCLDCDAEVSAKVLRLRTHHKKCPELIKTKTKSKSVKRPYDWIADTTPEPSTPVEPTEVNDQTPSIPSHKLPDEYPWQGRNSSFFSFFQ